MEATIMLPCNHQIAAIITQSHACLNLFSFFIFFFFFFTFSSNYLEKQKVIIKSKCYYPSGFFSFLNQNSQLKIMGGSSIFQALYGIKGMKTWMGRRTIFKPHGGNFLFFI